MTETIWVVEPYQAPTSGHEAWGLTCSCGLDLDDFDTFDEAAEAGRQHPCPLPSYLTEVCDDYRPQTWSEWIIEQEDCWCGWSRSQHEAGYD